MTQSVTDLGLDLALVGSPTILYHDRAASQHTTHLLQLAPDQVLSHGLQSDSSLCSDGANLVSNVLKLNSCFWGPHSLPDVVEPGTSVGCC